MTNKFLLYDLIEGSFLTEGFKPTKSNSIEQAAMFSDVSLPHVDTLRYLQIPLTQDFVDSLPFSLVDIDPQVPMSDSYNNMKALLNDFVVLTNFGFYDEVYNSLTDSSSPHIRSFALDDANLYRIEQLRACETMCITKTNEYMVVLIVPVSKGQQTMLKQLPAFSSEQEPYGFFMKPLGASQLDFDFVE